MNRFESLARRIRHSELLNYANPLWTAVRPAYESCLSVMYPAGLERVINGSDRIFVSSRLRSVPETYEPDVWHRFVSELRQGDVVADVGAYIGLFTIAASRRIGSEGRVFAFEPNPHILLQLRDQLRRNAVSNAEVIEAAVTATAGRQCFLTLRDSESSIASDPDQAVPVRATTVDDQFAGRRVDVMKIDVEGFEEDVLRGAEQILNDPARKPRAIFIEVHPYAWPRTGATSASLLGRLRRAGYTVQTMTGDPVVEITKYGEIVAVRA